MLSIELSQSPKTKGIETYYKIPVKVNTYSRHNTLGINAMVIQILAYVFFDLAEIEPIFYRGRIPFSKQA